MFFIKGLHIHSPRIHRNHTSTAKLHWNKSHTNIMYNTMIEQWQIDFISLVKYEGIIQLHHEFLKINRGYNKFLDHKHKGDLFWHSLRAQDRLFVAIYPIQLRGQIQSPGKSWNSIDNVNSLEANMSWILVSCFCIWVKKLYIIEISASLSLKLRLL